MNGKFYINISSADFNFFSKAKEENNNVRLTELCNKFIEKFSSSISYKNITNDDDKDEDFENEELVNKEEPNNKIEIKDSNKQIPENKIETKQEIVPTPIIKLKGSENPTIKRSFISLKMEIDTVLMFKLLIVLMIVAIVMIIIFLIRIEFRPLINFKIPNDYHHISMQPLHHNVKNFSIFNRYNDSGASQLFSLSKGKRDQPKLTQSEEIKQEIVNDLKPVMGTDGEKEEFHDKPIKTECFSSNYEFGI